MVIIKRIIPTFLLSLLISNSVIAGPGTRSILPWLITSITSVGSMGYMVGRSAQEVAPQITKQAIEQITTRAVTQVEQGPSLVAQAASSGWEAVKAIAPSLLSKEGVGIAAGLAASSAAWYGWRNRAAIAANGKKIIENNQLIQSLRIYVEQQFTKIKTKLDEFQSESRVRDEASEQRQQQILLRLSSLEEKTQTQGDSLEALRGIAQENNSLLRQIAEQLHRGQNRILATMGVPEGRSLWQHVTSLLSRNSSPTE